MNIGYILLIVVIFIVFWLVAVYNNFIKRRNRVQESWSDIEVQLKRRYNLIPNLVETVKGYATHEREVFTKVTDARAKAMQAESIKDRAEAERGLTGALKSLFAVAENYPNLRASENFQKLQDELTDTEDKIQAARRFYNGNVRDYNTNLEIFPNNLIASIFNFKKAEFFEIEEEEKEMARKVPEVKF